MTQQEQKQASKVQQDDRSPARDKAQKRPEQNKKDDLPGADGERSAGANEDTYD
jgi:hypothetical protein